MKIIPSHSQFRNLNSHSHDVHVWVGESPNSFGDLLGQLSHAILSNEERRQLDRYADGEAAARFAARRIFRRLILAKYLDVAPESILFRDDRYGRPYVQDAPYQFSASSTQGVLILAVSLQGPLGIDIEFIKPLQNLEQLMKSLASEGDAQKLLKTCEGDYCLEDFYRIWVGKEAALKAFGTGLLLSLDKAALNFGTQTAVIASFGPNHKETHLNLFPIPVDSCLAACLAVGSPVRPIDISLLPYLPFPWHDLISLTS